MAAAVNLPITLKYGVAGPIYIKCGLVKDVPVQSSILKASALDITKVAALLAIALIRRPYILVIVIVPEIWVIKEPAIVSYQVKFEIVEAVPLWLKI